MTLNPKRIMSMTRSGEFSIPPELLTPDQCGPSGGLDFHYSVTLTTDNLILDSKRFIIDNAAIHRFFLNRYSPTEVPCHSCESMCIEACEFFWELFNNEEPAIRRGLREYLTPLLLEDTQTKLTSITVHLASAGQTSFDYTIGVFPNAL